MDYTKDDQTHKKMGCTHRVNAKIKLRSGEERELAFWVKGKPTLGEIQAFVNKTRCDTVTLVEHHVICL